MTNFDLVEKLRERANVSYEEARAALDATGGDLLDALIYLEKQGKVAPPPSGGSYSSKAEEQANRAIKQIPQKNQKGESFDSMVKRFFRWCGEVFSKGNTNYFEVSKGGGKILSVPVTVLVLLLVLAPWITLPLLIAGLFLGCRYAFLGADVEKMSVNSVMDSAANAADSLKSEVKREVENAREAHNDHINKNNEDK